VTGEVNQTTVEKVTPIVGVMQNLVHNVETPHTTIVNLKDGKVENQENQPLVRVGTK
jgi:hypothetical protein